MGVEQNKMEELFKWDGKPDVAPTISLALQHLVAMIIGCVTPAIIISDVAGLEIGQRIILIQASLTMSAVCTFLQLFPLKKGVFGAGLPMILGISFAYLPSMQAIAKGRDGVGAIVGAMMVGGIVAVVVGLFVKSIRKFFPPLITGTVVFTIGLSLYPTAVNYMAGGVANKMQTLADKGITINPALYYGSWQNWLVAFVTLIAVMCFSVFGKGIFKLASILLGMLVGYLVALGFGMITFDKIGTASWFALPHFLPFGVSFNAPACISIGLLFAINSIQAIGDFTATTMGGFNREPSDDELRGGIIAYGATNFLTAFFGGLPTATYSQNVGIVISNKVVARRVFATTGVFILICGLCPKFSALLTTIPQCVLGGATITVFSTIAMTGIKLITQEPLTARSTTVVGLAAAIGVGIAQAPASLELFPTSFTMIFGKSPVVLATIIAVFLNIVLPKEEKKA